MGCACQLQDPDQLPDASRIRQQNLKMPLPAGFHQFSAVNDDLFHITLQKAQGLPVNLAVRGSDCGTDFRILNEIQFLVVDEPDEISILKSGRRH